MEHDVLIFTKARKNNISFAKIDTLIWYNKSNLIGGKAGERYQFYQ